MGVTMQAIVNDPAVLYLFPDDAVIVGREVTINGVTTTMGDSGNLSIVHDVSLPAGTPPFICTYNGATVSIDSALQAAWLARQAVVAGTVAAPKVAIITASFAAGLRRQAAALNSQGKSYEAIQLLLQAQRISP